MRIGSYRLAPMLALLAVVAGPLAAPPAASAALSAENPPCGPIGHSFRLSGDRFCDGGGWVVTADGITIDLGGFELSSDRADDTGESSDEIGIEINGHRNVTIRNGAITGFEHAVYGSHVDNAAIDRVVAARNLSTGIILGGNGAVVRDSTVVANGAHGASLYGARFTGNVAAQNRLNGFSFIDVFSRVDESPEITRNIAAANGGTGFAVEGDDILLEGNRAFGNDATGFWITPSSVDVTLRRNVATANTPHGILVSDGATGIRINKNVAHANGQPDPTNAHLGRGIEVEDDAPFNPENATGSGNLARGNDTSPLGNDCRPSTLCVAKGTSKTDLPADDPGCDGTIERSFKLTSNTALCPGDGWRFGKKRNVTIDLNGFTLRGNSVNDLMTEIGIDVEGTRDVTIRNGVIEGFDHGISAGANGAKNLVLKNIVVADNDGDGVLHNGTGRFSRVTAADNGLIGLVASRAVLRNSVAVGNGFSSPSTSGDNGISLRGGPDASSKNFAVANDGEGFVIVGSLPVVLEANGSFGNLVGFGVLAGGTVLKGNRATGNGVHGILVEASTSKVALRRNTAHGNGFSNADGEGGGIVAGDAPKVSGGGNLAQANDGPDCTPGLC